MEYKHFENQTNLLIDFYFYDYLNLAKLKGKIKGLIQTNYYLINVLEKEKEECDYYLIVSIDKIKDWKLYRYKKDIINEE